MALSAPLRDPDDAATACVVVAGHVDHGKSTLIGRLVYDLGLLPEATIDDVIASSGRRGVSPEWSFVLDALQEERDQAVTIDTTRLWFTHAGRRFALIDAPGHRQFLANMLSGASDADAAILVVDAAEGIGDQTRRHAYLLSFLGIAHVVVALNKIDLVEDVEATVAALGAEVERLLWPLVPAAVVPVSARYGTNVAVAAGSYSGPTILEALTAAHPRTAYSSRPLRFCVQDVYRRDGSRIAVGVVSSGTLRVGQDVALLPSRDRLRIARIVRWPETTRDFAVAGESVGLVFHGERFVARGDVLADPASPPMVGHDLDLELFWLDPCGPRVGETLRLKRGTQLASATVLAAPSVYDIEATSQREDGDAQFNIVQIRLRAGAALVFDRRDDDASGARCVVLRGDDVVAIGFAVDAVPRGASSFGPVTLMEREQRQGHRAGIIWLTGLSGAGKSTLAYAVERRLFERGITTSVVDGDAMRARLNADLGFSASDRAESVRRAASVADLRADNGHVVIVSMISPSAFERSAAHANARHPFHEVYINAPLATCEARDPKGLYKRARAGELTEFTGIDAPYDAPEHPALELRTDLMSLEECTAALVAYIERHVL